MLYNFKYADSFTADIYYGLFNQRSLGVFPLHAL